MTLNLREPIALQEDYVGGANGSVCRSNATIEFWPGTTFYFTVPVAPVIEDRSSEVIHAAGQ
jgi:hypothetical protein